MSLITLRLLSLMLWGCLWAASNLLAVTAAAQSLNNQAQQLTAQEQRLQQRLFTSQAVGRDDLIADAKQRLALVAPHNPEVLVLDFQAAVAEQDTAAQTRILELAQTLANPSLQQRLEVLHHLSTPKGQEALQQARFLALAGQTEAAVASYSNLLGKQPPLFSLRLEYWRQVSNLEERRAEALQQLLRLNKQYPGNAELQLLLARELLAVDRPQEAISILRKFQGGLYTRNHKDNAAEIEYAYLTRLPISPAAVAGLQEFIGFYLDSPLRPAAQKNLAAQQQLLADPNWRAGQRGADLVQQTNYTAAEPLLKRGLQAYPDTGNWYGSLGQALLHLGRYSEAEQNFALAVTKLGQQLSGQSAQQAIPVVQSITSAWLAKWESLRLYNQSLIFIAQGASQQQEGNLDAARDYFLAAVQVQPQEVTAYLRLHNLELELGSQARAQSWLARVMALHPQDDRVIYAAVSYYRERDPQQARQILAALPAAMQTDFADLRLRLLQEELSAAIEEARATGDEESLAKLLHQSVALSPQDPWATYRLATFLTTTGQETAADQAFVRHLEQQPALTAATAYAYAVYLANQGRDVAVLNSLSSLPAAQWDADIQAFYTRSQQRLQLQAAQQLFAAGQLEAATQLLLQQPDPAPAANTESTAANTQARAFQVQQYLTLAEWQRQADQPLAAAVSYQRVLELEEQNFAANLGWAEVHLANGDKAAAAQLVTKIEANATTSPYLLRRLGDVWAELGATKPAVAAYQQALAQEVEAAHVYRNLARLYRQPQPELALRYYAQGLQASGQLAAGDFSKTALTQATHIQPEDDWLVRGLRSETASLYRQHNTSVQLQQDFGWRSDSSASGLSDLHRHATLLRLETPLAQGRGFVQVEQLRLKAASARNSNLGWCAVVEDCNTPDQNASGTGLSLGWLGEKWSADLGTSPLGFKHKNWLGGLAYANSWNSYSYRLRLTRRPLSNTLISYAGAVDPVTGRSWGGVTATGATLGLGYDTGGIGGLWSNLGVHQLKGHRVQTNQRLTLMGGYYHRWLDKPDRRLRLGINLMHWRYAKGMDEFTFGQGGYYSPQNYASVSVPLSYAWRNYQWSFLLGSSIGWSRSSYAGGDQLYLGSAPASFNPATNPRLVNSASRSQGVSLRSQLLAERRLSDHWALGAGWSWGYSKSYAPNQAFVYLRYVVKPWRGSLDLPAEALTPSADWN